jgi:thiamine biosynthesis lipoprotein
MSRRFGRAEFPALGTTALLIVTDEDRLAVAERVLRAELCAIDLACSRFDEDSEISRAHRQAGRAIWVSPLLTHAVEVALRAARLTDGLVDPTVGAAVRDLGYDRDFTEVTDRGDLGGAQPAPGWHRVLLDTVSRELVIPRGVEIDLGATAKALAADRAAQAIAREIRCGVLVSLGGDVSVAGEPPGGGWRIGVGDDHAPDQPPPDTPVVSIRSGGLATSSITRRTWLRGDRRVHHIVDPRTGECPDPLWRTVSVAAGSCVDANTASTAAIVAGADAPGWLAGRSLPARLVDVPGRVLTVGGWPAEARAERGAA